MAVSRPRDNGGQEPAAATLRLLEPRPFRPFKSSEEYLYAMKEDLAEWLHTLYGLDINADNFCDVLDTGVVLCQHANKVRETALEYHKSGRNGLTCPIPKGPTYRTDVSTNAFHARDNVSNFITWCRALEIRDCLLFETDDLVMRKNEKSVILCLLEVARRGSKVGMLAPLLVQLEEEIDREIAEDTQKRLHGEDRATSPLQPVMLLDFSDYGPHKQIITNDLKSLDEMVRDLVNRCTCPTQFYIERISEGKYRIGDTKILIFVRILRSHVMVRVGGGWDTLAHFLDKHDPCRCRQGHRATVSSKLTVKFGQGNPADTQMGVSYVRTPAAGASSSPPALPPVPLRQTSPLSLPIPPPLPASSPPRQRRVSTSSSSSSSHKLSNSSLASLPGDTAAREKSTAIQTDADVGAHQQQSFGDSSSEHSDEGYRSSASRMPSMERSNPPKNLRMVTEGDGGALVDAGLGESLSPISPCTEDDECYHSQATTPKNGLKNGSRSKAVPPQSLDVPKAPPSSKNVPGHGYEIIVPLDLTSNDKRAIHASTTSLLSQSAAAVATAERRRRLSGDQRTVTAGAATMTRRIPRSRSSHGGGDGSDPGGDFTRNQGGRYSYRSLRGTHPPKSYAGLSVAAPPTAAERNHTWSSPRRSIRPPLTTEMFTARTPPGGGSPQRHSVARGRASLNSSLPQSLQTSPVEHLPPEIQEFINKGLYKDKKVLELIRAVMSEPGHIAPYDECDHTGALCGSLGRQRRASSHSQGIASPHSPDSGSDAGDDLTRQVATAEHSSPNRDVRLKISPRKDNHPNGGSRIPMPKYDALVSLVQ